MKKMKKKNGGGWRFLLSRPLRQRKSSPAESQDPGIKQKTFIQSKLAFGVIF